MDYSEQIIALDQADDMIGLHAFLHSTPLQLNELVFTCFKLLKLKRLNGPILIARMLRGRAFNPALGVAQAFGGIKSKDPDEIAAGCAHLRQTIDRLPPDWQRQFYFELEPLIYNLIGNAFEHPEGVAIVSALTDVLTAMTPPLRSVFDLDREPAGLKVDDIRQTGRAAARLITFKPRQPPPSPRSAVIALRARFFPQDPASRPFEIGALLTDAMERYGWRVLNHGMEWDKNMANDLPRLKEACISFKPDILVMDEQIVGTDSLRVSRAQLVRELRADLPGLKVVGLHLDPWSLKEPALVASADAMDVVWTFAPDLPAWRHQAFAGKLFRAPLPYPASVSGDAAPLAPRLTFHGSVLTYNWPRWVWLNGFKTRGLPVDIGLADHKSDDLPPLDSFVAYLGALGRAGAVLNFGMRSDLTIATTGRTFEVLAAGALLVQERTPELDNYLIAGEHYLPFSTFADVRATIELIRAHPEQATAVRDRGRAFFRDRYAPEKIVSYLDAALYPPT